MVTICSDGYEYLARYVNSSGYFGTMAYGSSGLAEASSHTALSSELTAGGGERVAANSTYEATNKSVWISTLTATTNLTVREVGIFNSTTIAGSKMLMRHVFAADKSMVATNTLQVTAKLTAASTT